MPSFYLSFFLYFYLSGLSLLLPLPLHALLFLTLFRSHSAIMSAVRGGQRRYNSSVISNSLTRPPSSIALVAPTRTAADKLFVSSAYCPQNSSRRWRAIAAMITKCSPPRQSTAKSFRRRREEDRRRREEEEGGRRKKKREH